MGDSVRAPKRHNCYESVVADAGTPLGSSVGALERQKPLKELKMPVRMGVPIRTGGRVTDRHILYRHILSCSNVRMVSRSRAFIWPGAEALPTAPKVAAEPKTSPLRRLIRPVPAMDMVMIGRSA